MRVLTIGFSILTFTMTAAATPSASPKTDSKVTVSADKIKARKAFNFTYDPGQFSTEDLILKAKTHCHFYATSEQHAGLPGTGTKQACRNKIVSTVNEKIEEEIRHDDILMAARQKKGKEN